jgi:hypothetical protein
VTSTGFGIISIIPGGRTGDGGSTLVENNETATHGDLLRSVGPTLVGTSLSGESSPELDRFFDVMATQQLT